MSTFFNETFPNDGLLAGQSPQVALPYGTVWDGGSNLLTAAAGFAVVPTPANSNSPAAGVYGTGGDYGLANVPLRMTFTMKTPPDLSNVDGVNHGGVQLTLKNNGISTAVKVWGVLSGGTITWYANINTATYVNITAELAPSTEYTGIVDVSNGLQTFTFLGHALTNTVAFADVVGFGGIALTVWGYSSVASVVVGSNVDGAGDYQAPGTANAALVAPSPTLYARNGFSGSALLAPAAQLAAHGGAWMALTGTVPTLYATGHNSTGERVASLTAPRAALSAFGGANARLASPMPTLASTGIAAGWGSASLSAPTAAVSAAGTVSSTAQAELAAPMAALIGYSGAVCSITLTGKATLAASGSTGAVGSAALTCPLFELTAGGTAQNHGSADLLSPSPRLGATAQAWLIAPAGKLSAIGTAVVTATYEAYSINLTHAPGNPTPVDKVTRYTNFPFTHVVRYQGSYFGAAADGLYLLEGTTDDGAAITYAVKTCIDDFKAPELKTVASAFLSGRLGPDVTVSLHAGEDGQQAYDFNTLRGTAARNHREKFGRGVKNRYFALGLAGTGALELDSIELEINKMKRKV